MNKIVLPLILSLMMVPALASADESPRFKYVGMQVDVGVPDGAAVGVVVRPKLNWLRLNLSGTYNVLSPGIRGGFTLDPIKFPIAPTLTLEGGHSFKGTVPGIASNPEVSYNYANLHLGIEFGNRDSWRFFIHGGPSWINAQTYDFENTIGNKDKSLSVSDPSVSARVFPTAKLGFALYF